MRIFGRRCGRWVISFNPAANFRARQGLKPTVFHHNRDKLLSTPKQDLTQVIAEIKSSSVQNTVIPNSSHLVTTTEIPPSSGLSLGVTSAIDDLGPSDKRLVFQLTRSTADEIADPAPTTNHLFYRIPKSKKGETYFLNTVLPACTEAASKAARDGKEVLVVDDDGKDVSVGVMIALSWILIDDDGNRRSGPAPAGGSTVASGTCS